MTFGPLAFDLRVGRKYFIDGGWIEETGKRPGGYKISLDDLAILYSCLGIDRDWNRDIKILERGVPMVIPYGGNHKIRITEEEFEVFHR